MVKDNNQKKATTKFNISLLVRNRYDDGVKEWEDIHALLSEEYPNEKITDTAVQMALHRYKVKLRSPTEAAETFKPEIYNKKGGSIGKLTDLVKLQVSDEAISPIFKEVINYKAWAKDRGIEMKISDIVSILDKSNQLKKNESEFVEADRLVEMVCERILRFRTDLDRDPDIDDMAHMFMEDDEE